MRVLISQKPMGYSTVKLTLQIDCYHESYRWIKREDRSWQIIVNHIFSWNPWLLILIVQKCNRPQIFLGFTELWSIIFSQFSNIEYTKINQGNHERPLPARWHYRSINGKTFPFSPVHRYIHYCEWVPLDKLWQYAKPVKPRLSSLVSLEP